MYKQPKNPDNVCIAIYEKLLCNLTPENANIVIAGDFNINMSNGKNYLIDILDVNGMQNIVKDPTCL